MNNLSRQTQGSFLRVVGISVKEKFIFPILLFKAKMLACSIVADLVVDNTLTGPSFTWNYNLAKGIGSVTSMNYEPRLSDRAV